MAAAAEPAVAALLPGGVPGSVAPSGAVPVLFCFSVFARPSSVPHGAGYELLIQKFVSLYGDQIDLQRKFVMQLFAEEWGQFVDLPKGFAVSERCKVRLVPLQSQVGPCCLPPLHGTPFPSPSPPPARPDPQVPCSLSQARPAQCIGKPGPLCSCESGGAA